MSSGLVMDDQNRYTDVPPVPREGDVERQAGAHEQALGQSAPPNVSLSTSSSIRNSQLNSGSGVEEKEGKEFIVKWDGPDDPGCPLNTPEWRKWMMVIILAVSCQCVTCCSSMAGNTYGGMEAEFGVSREVCVLSISLFVAGLGVGPLFLGPVSEFIGRSRVMHMAFLWFFLLNFPVAFANNIAVHLVFRFLTGFGGSAFLSVSGGAISDVFKNEKVGTPMMLFSAAPFIGPVLGPLVSGFINEHTDWRWTYYVIIIWAFVMVVLLFTFVPETYDPELLRRRAVLKRKETGDSRYKSPRELANKSFLTALSHSLKTPFVLLSTQLMVLFLDLWSAIILGILYLSFGGIPYVFSTVYGFSLQQTGLSFLGIGLGQVIAVATQPYFNKKYRQTVIACGGTAPPEARLVAGMYGAILCPLGLLLFGATSLPNVPWIIPIFSTIFFGMGMVYAYTSTFTYLVDAYRPVAASALASNSFLRSAFAAGFPLFGNQMYERLGAVGGSCLLAGLMALCIPLPFIFYRIGGGIREKSNFAAT